MARFILTHKMMSVCLMDAAFYEAAPVFKPVHKIALREYEIRKKALETGAKRGCSSCGKRRAARVRQELEKRHGAVFAQAISAQLAKLPHHKFVGPIRYIKSHIKSLTGADAGVPIGGIMLYVPMKNPKTGVVEAIELEL